MKRGGEYDEVYRETVLPTLLFCDAGRVMAGPPDGRETAEDSWRTDALGSDIRPLIIDLPTSCVTEYWCVLIVFQTPGQLAEL